MDTQQLLKLYKESLESVLTSLENKKYSAETFGKRQELQKKIPGQTDCEDTDYEHFVKTSNSVREQLDKYVRKVDDCGLVLKRIWDIRKKHKDKIKLRSITLTYEEETSQYDKYLKFLFAMEKMIESIGKMDDKPKTSPDDATSQVLSHKRKEPEKKQQSADLHKEDSVDEDNKDVVIGDNSNTICQQPTNEMEEEDKEPKNEDVKGDESKRREEVTEVHNRQKEEENGMINEYKMYEKEYNKLTEENTAYQQRHQKYQKDYNKAKEEKTTLQERCEDLEKCINTLEDKNSKLQQRLDRLQSPISVQVKELQKRIDIKTAENESLTKILKSQEKYMKETERSGQRSLLQTAPHISTTQNIEVEKRIYTLTAEKESLMQILSLVAGMKMGDNNQDIDELGDPNRSMKIAERFREIYDNEWTNLLDYITDNTDATDDIAIQQIVTAIQKIFGQCQCEIIQMKRRVLKSIGYPEDTFEKQYTGGKAGHDPIVKMMKDLVQISTEHIYERVLQEIKEIGEIKTILQIGGKSADVFLTKCSKLCSLMCVKDPPMVLDFNFKRGDPFDKDKLSPLTRSGDIVDYLVWPVLYLYENGPVMSKGVAQ